MSPDNPLRRGALTYNGMQVVIVPDEHLVDRTWRERLFSWPWRPWVRTKYVENIMVPVGDALSIGGTLHMRRATWNELEKSLGPS